MGLILSISLITTINIYTDTISSNLNQSDSLSTLYPPNFIFSTHGKLNSSSIKEILHSSSISHGYPYKTLHHEISINKNSLFCKVIGADLIYLSSHLNEQRSNLNENNNLKNIFLVSNKKSLSEKEKVPIIVNSYKTHVYTIFDEYQHTPTLLMDISMLHSIFNINDIDRFYIDTHQANNVRFSDMSQFDLASNSNTTQNLSNAFFINLQFIGLFSTVISILLIYLFFRFIQKHRHQTDVLLISLGINSFQQKVIRIMEALFFIIITSSLGFLLGILLSNIGIDILSQTINTLYYSISVQNLTILPSSLFKSVLISSVAVLLSLSSFIQTFEHKIQTISNTLKITICIGFIALSCALIFVIPEHPFTAFISMTGMILLSFFVTLCLTSLCCFCIEKIKLSKLVMLKTSIFYIKKDIILSSLMILSIALACGLYITMTIFINSFQDSVASWIQKSTQADIYIQHKNNSIPTPVPLKHEDIQAITNHVATQSWSSISRDNLMINGNPIILRGISFQNIYNEIEFIAIDPLKKISNKSILISESASKKLNLQLGDSINIPFPSTEIQGNVDGIYIDYASEHGVITISKSLMKDIYKTQFKIHGLSLITHKQNQQELIESFDHLLIQTKEELQDYVLSMFKQTFSLTWVLASITGIIALFVLINMLSVLAIDRKLEFIQLFSIGGQKKHILQLILFHSLWIGFISLFMTFFVAFFLSWIIFKQLTPIYFGWTIPITLHSLSILYLVLFIVIIIVMTAFIAYRYIWVKTTHNESINESIKTLYFSR